MTKRLAHFFAATFLALSSASASWVDLPMEDVVLSSPLVVVAKVGEIRTIPTEREGVFRDIAQLHVELILKNESGEEVVIDRPIELAMPSKKSQFATGNDILYPEGREGVWILEKEGDHWMATYPKDYQKKDQKAAIEKIVAAQKDQLYLRFRASFTGDRDLPDATALIRLWEYDPLLADASAKEIARHEVKRVPLSKDAKGALFATIKAERSERKSYYLTAFIYPPGDLEGKRLYFIDGFQKVFEKTSHENLEISLKPTKR